MHRVFRVVTLCFICLFNLAVLGDDPEPSPLILSSTVGGFVSVAPEAGVSDGQGNLRFSLSAVPIDTDLFVFDRWSGTVVEAGGVTDVHAAETQVTLRSPGTLHAHFLALRDSIYVDANTPKDDYADGTAAFPLPCIQQAIDVADSGAQVLVQPGTYLERLHFQGRDISVTADLGNQGLAGYPVVDARNQGTTVTFERGETSACHLSGFVITGGWNEQSGGLLCVDSGPTLSHCLIVGNRSLGSESGASAIHCQSSSASFLQCTIADNVGNDIGAAVRLIDSNVRLHNSILYNIDSATELSVDTDSHLRVTYCCVRAGWPGIGNLEEAPGFVAPGYWEDPIQPGVEVDAREPDVLWQSGEYHLRSFQGHWDPVREMWQQNGQTSPCIDAGDPLTSPESEPMPNGGIVNLGAYGQSAQASLSEKDVADEPVYFADMNLKAAVEAELGIVDPSQSDMLALTNLRARDKGITCLGGLEHAHNLQEVTFRWNEITDISPLRGLRELTSLDISQNEIVDISVLSKFRKLTRLDMHMNEIDDISAIDGLEELTYLDVHYNHIKDISALSDLSRLRSLYLFLNEISDLSPLSGLTGLQALDLMKNNISDISALGDLQNLNWLRLSKNSIREISPLRGLSRLRYLYLEANQIQDLTHLGSMFTLLSLFLRENAIEDISPLIQLDNLTRLDLRNNPLNSAAHDTHLDQIADNNPGIIIQYTSRTNP